MALDFSKYHTVVEDDRTGKTVEVFNTPTKESIDFLKNAYVDEGLNEDIWVLPLDEALDFVKKNYPNRTTITAIGVSKKVKNYIKSQGFDC